MAEKKEEKKVEKKSEPKATKGMVKVNYMKPRGDKSKDIKVSLNGQIYHIPYGEDVEVPIGVKEIIDDSIKAMENAEIYEEEHII
jgi:hypothetical protein